MASGGFWDVFTGLSTFAGSVALIVGGTAAFRQLREAQQSREEEMLLRLAAVYHDTIPVKRRIVAAQLSELIASQNGCPDDRRRNALADLMRFFETVSTVVSHLNRRGRLRRALDLARRRESTGSSGVTSAVASDYKNWLIEDAMPDHGPNRVILALKQIYGHAEERSRESLGGKQPAATDGDTDDPSRSDSVSLEFGRYAAGYCCALLLLEKPKAGLDKRVDADFHQWTKRRVLNFLQRECIAMTCEELSEQEKQKPAADAQGQQPGNEQST